MFSKCLHTYDFPISKALHVSVSLQFPFRDPKSAPHMDQQCDPTRPMQHTYMIRYRQIICSSQQIMVTSQDNEDQEVFWRRDRGACGWGGGQKSAPYLDSQRPRAVRVCARIMRPRVRVSRQYQFVDNDQTFTVKWSPRDFRLHLATPVNSGKYYQLSLLPDSNK